jgi:hypothetical protein
MATPAIEWQSLADSFDAFARRLEKTRTVNVNAKPIRSDAVETAQHYFRYCRPMLLELHLDTEVSTLDAGFQGLILLASGKNALSTYKKHLKSIRRAIPQVTTQIELSHSAGKAGSDTSAEDMRVIKTLEGLVPSAALSYRQAIIDLSDDKRLSFRGPALELREALRETLDHLAPDTEVKAMPGFALEKDQKGPTMKQKVRFILKARGQSKSASVVPEQSTTTVEEMVGSLTRSIYTLSSVATHVASERKAVIQIRRYVVAALHDILEL